MAFAPAVARADVLRGERKPVDRSAEDGLGGPARRASERLDELGNGGEEILLETVVGDAEDRRLGILVDRDDDLRVLHPGEVLDRAADADGDVELRRDDLAGLPDLPVVGRIAGVYRGAARAERGAELVGERRQDLVELVARAERAAARDDDLGRGQLGSVELGDLGADEARLAGVGDRLHGLDRRRSAARCRRVEAGRAHRDHVHRIEALHGRDRVAGVDRALEGVGVDDLGDVRDLADVEPGGHARRDVLARGGRGKHDVAVAAGDREHLRGDVLGERVREDFGVGVQHLGDAGDLRRCRCRCLRAAAGDEDVDLAAELRRRSDGVERRRADRLVVVLGDDECVDLGHVRSPSLRS
jgi:hypothetical protein